MPMSKKIKKPTGKNPTLTLNSRQNLFCYEYLKDRNATQAAIRAGFSAKTSYVIGPRLLSHPHVAYKINRLVETQLDNLKVDADLVLKEILKLAMVDLQDIFDTKGNLRPVEEMPENVRKAISSIEVFEEFEGQGKFRKSIGFTKKIRFWPKEKALEMLAKYLKMFGEEKLPSGATFIFGDIKIEQEEAPKLLTDINSRLSMQFSKQ